MATTGNDVLRTVLCESMSNDHVMVIEQLEEPIYDEDIAEKLGIKATVVRTLLNDLHENNLVEYHRTKNKSTGWYTYKWCKREDKIKDHVRNYLQARKTDLQNKLSEETDNLSFTCGCNRITYNEAMDANFECIDCGKNYSEYNNSDVIEDLVENITNIDSILEATYDRA